MNPSEIKKVARNFYESYNYKDLDRSFNDFIAIDLINHTMGGGFDREKWFHFDKAFLTACPDLQLTVKEQYAEDDRVVTHWTCSGTHTTEFFGMPASGNTVQLTGICIDGIENGKIKEHFAMADFTQFMQQFAKKNQ
ncbi:MAG: ester cyclase [Chitinophagaceae bacterium]|nr:ester cyclase [Chitinophagaceae bacterium]